MRYAVVLLALVACKGEDKRPAEPARAAIAPVAPGVDKPADDMDEKMRHCPISLAGVKATVSDVEGGVQFEVRGQGAAIDDIRKRAKHVVEFAAGRAQAGVHGGGQGGGKMRNCPIVTNGVVIAVDEIAEGAKLTITPASGGSVDDLRNETKARLDKFAFDGVTVERR